MAAVGPERKVNPPLPEMDFRKTSQKFLTGLASQKTQPGLW